MRDKLRQLDETYLDLVIGILLCGVLSAILGMIITRGDLRYLIGAIVGTIFALVMITTMMVSIQKSVQMDTHQASRNMIKSALIRYVATLVILYVMIKLSMSAFIAALVGFLSSKFAAFLQKLLLHFLQMQTTIFFVSYLFLPKITREIEFFINFSLVSSY